MKIITTWAICLSSTLLISSCSDSKTKAAPQEQKETAAQTPASSVITDRHVKIPNSHLYIIPPAGFAVSEVSGSIAKGEGDGESYAHFLFMQILRGLTQEKYFAELKAKADKDFPGSWKQEDIIVDGHKATIYQYNTGGIYQHYLAFTDGYTDEMIIANFEEREASTGKEMYEAMKTVVLKK